MDEQETTAIPEATRALEEKILQLRKTLNEIPKEEWRQKRIEEWRNQVQAAGKETPKTEDEVIRSFASLEIGNQEFNKPRENTLAEDEQLPKAA